VAATTRAQRSPRRSKRCVSSTEWSWFWLCSCSAEGRGIGGGACCTAGCGSGGGSGCCGGQNGGSGTEQGTALSCQVAALNLHFMLVNYTGAAGDLPGKIPRKIGPRGRKIRPLDLWPWSEKLHFVMPGRLRTFGSEPGRTCATDIF
jgi:hypothetical protein